MTISDGILRVKVKIGMPWVLSEGLPEVEAQLLDADSKPVFPQPHRVDV